MAVGGWLGLHTTTDYRPGREQVLVEPDGSHVRTGKKIALAGAELTKKTTTLCANVPDWRDQSRICSITGAQMNERS